jgi:hypothetical protein
MKKQPERGPKPGQPWDYTSQEHDPRETLVHVTDDDNLPAIKRRLERNILRGVHYLVFVNEYNFGVFSYRFKRRATPRHIREVGRQIKDILRVAGWWEDKKQPRRKR